MILDHDGYPTDEVLDLIPRWTATPESLVHDVLDPIFAAYGSVAVEERVDGLGRDVIEVRLVTCGWSGCESAVGALKRGCFWFAWWMSSVRGGQYTFEVPATAWNSPMTDWSKVVEAQTQQSQVRRTLVLAAFGDPVPRHDDVELVTDAGLVSVRLFLDGQKVAHRTLTAAHALQVLVG